MEIKNRITTTMNKQLKKWRIKKWRNQFGKKTASFLMAVLLLIQSFYPTASYALTGGPSQPEVGGFTPIETSDMVDLSSGDFKYNIPLMDMDGYPLNLAYDGNVSMDQEASWVGLGWSMNPGVINRSMRGLPDDFKGDAVIKETNIKPNRSFELSGGLSGEIFGLEGGGNAFSGNLSYNLGLNYSNYNGIKIEQTLGLSMNANLGPLTAGLGINSSSENGLMVQPNVGLEFKVQGDEKDNTSLGLKVGSSFNARSGVKQLTINAELTNKTQDANGENKTSNTNDAFSAGGSFDLGMPTYTPMSTNSMHNLSISARFTGGGAALGIHPTLSLSANYSGQKLISTTQTNNAYGYFNLESGIDASNALMDFNRENDGVFTKETPNLPLASLTYDMFGVSGQGIGGSYRPFRSDIGYIKDPASYSTSEGFSIGAEFGVGNLAHSGGDLAINENVSSNTAWISGNNVASKLKYGNKPNTPDYETYYFKEANEKSIESDPSLFNGYGGYSAIRFRINEQNSFNTTLEADYRTGYNTTGATPIPTNNYRSKRDKRNQVIHNLTVKELKDNLGIASAHPYMYAGAKDHHIGQIVSYGNDGMRYVYGLPAYNTSQKEITFAVGRRLYNTDGISETSTNINYQDMLVNYSVPLNQPDPNSVNNNQGLDNYYSCTTTPAYAHSFLLTSILSPDYVDADNVKGPSSGDLGYYTKFDYVNFDKSNGGDGVYNWRTPYQSKNANYNRGQNADPYDDKASIIYGTKELLYIKTIESKNYVAVFSLEPRKDAIGVIDENGGINTGDLSYLLRKIALFTRAEYNKYLVNQSSATPIKTVNFEYDYSLCPGIPNYNGSVAGSNSSELPSSGNTTGKLTLKKVYFTYQNSNKARLSPYSFTYNSNNPNYSPKAYDRWGNYKPPVNSNGSATSALTTGEFPYVEQNKANQDIYAQSWTLKIIDLPSGGQINVEYESDDYAFIQNKKAGQMCKIEGMVESATTPTTYTLQTQLLPKTYSSKSSDHWYAIKMDANTTANDYLGGLNYIYFRTLMKVTPTNDYDYVSGYATIDASTEVNGYLLIKLGAVKIDDRATENPKSTDPIIRTAIQYARLNLSRFVYGDPMTTEPDNFGSQLLSSFFSSAVVSNLINNISETVQGPNNFLFSNSNKLIGTQIIIGKSFFRLNNPNGKKLGGGVRVKTIKIKDNWTSMGGSDLAEYGQEYFYTNTDGKSSGVATYEPQIGGDENSFKQPIFYDINNIMAPDEKMYQETPLGESFFPNPTVTYSRVTVRNLDRTNVTRHGTGRTVHEFYTTKDFPTIVSETALDKNRNKTNPFSIASLFSVKSKDHMTASQGFTIELNDMNGKPKKQSTYAENAIDPFSVIEYKYKSEAYGDGSFKLVNDINTVKPDGNQSQERIGVFMDAAADFRESKSEGNSFKEMLNLDAFVIFGVIPVPTIWASLSSDEVQFRSATFTKVIQRFGIQEETIATENGSTVKTKNLAWDSETGDVLVTQTTNNFDDPVYTLNYPAHWYYNEMGQAYKNIGLTIANMNFNTAGLATYTNAKAYFVPGDEVIIGGNTLAWVTEVYPNSIKVVKKDGASIVGSKSIKVIRSGRKNMANANIANVTTLTNPLTNFKNNVFENVLQASAIEYTDKWRTFCDCYGTGANSSSTNPYVLGLRGNWSVKKSMVHLAGRTQSITNDNSNLRKDGVMTSFTPYYKLNGANWETDSRNWTYTSEVTEKSPFSQELENRDALGRYSAATFGYRQTMATSVAANAKYKQIGYDNFEDYGISVCADNHFKFNDTPNSVSAEAAHSGKNSIKVVQGTDIIMKRNLATCNKTDCNLAISSPVLQGSDRVFTILNGSGPYQITMNVISGDPAYYSFSNGFKLTGSGYSVEIVIKDDKGCYLTQVLTY